MPYTRGWNDGTPAGSRAANQIDDAIREFKVDVHERMDSTFAVDWLADPVVAKDSIIGKVTGRFMIFGPHIFEARNDEDNTDHDDEYFEMLDTGLTIVGSAYLPHGITVKKLEASMDRQGAATASLAFYKVNYTTGVPTTIDTVTKNVGGIGIHAGAGGALTEIIDSSINHYAFKFTGAFFVGSGPRLYCVRLTVDIPSAASSV